MFGKRVQVPTNTLARPAAAQQANVSPAAPSVPDFRSEFNDVRSLLLGMPGLGTLQELVDKIHPDMRTIYPSPSYSKAAAERLGGEEMRGHVFDCLCVLGEHHVWTAKDVEGTDWHSKKSFDLGCFCMSLSAGLLDTGFPLSPARIEAALKHMAVPLPLMYLSGWAYSYQICKLGIIREMQKAVKSGTAMTPAARTAAAQLLSLLLQLPKDKQVQPELKDSPVIKALRELAGQDKQQTFFERMLAAGNMREHDSMVSRFTPHMHRAWNDILAQCQTILKDYSDYKAGRKSAPWVTDKAAFEAALGDHPNYLEHRFGWWLAPQPAGAGSHPMAASLLGKVGTDRFPTLSFQTSERFAETCKKAAIEDAKQRFLASASNVMDIEGWSFGGMDSDGLLLNSFEKRGRQRACGRMEKGSQSQHRANRN